MSKTLLEELGELVWRRIADGETLGVRQGEVTLTDHVLLEVCRRATPSVRVWKVGPVDERTVGADFDLWVSRGRGYRRHLVQAKRMDRDQESYRTLGHKVGMVRQADLLWRASSILNAVPLYALYNYRPHTIVGRFWNCCEPEQIELFGWTVVRLERVRRALGRRGCRTFEFLHEDKSARPVRCLLCPITRVGELAASSTAIALDPEADTIRGLFEDLPSEPPGDAEPPNHWIEAAGYYQLEPHERPSYAVVISDGA